MDNKEKIIKSFIETLKDSFVNEFEKIDYSRNLVNNYMKEINFDYQYDYNTFCIEFLDTTDKILNSLTNEEILLIDINMLIYETFMNMVKNKIFNSTNNDNDKQKLILLHELKKYLIKKDIND
ncbi:hypothetical protein [Trichloromonas sp.]|uniref:hypothetical protein n=1 Tax=Trichloromonas sp. TaxID=3069249 RepID=UPI002A4DB8AB|nr:hypothetical protein [Trichloromonas sp.]